MAGVKFTVATEEISTGTSQKTMVQIVAAANHRVEIIEWSISFDGTSNTAAPIEFFISRQTTGGTTTAFTLQKMNEDDGETIQATAGVNATVEPTTNSVALMAEQIHPQGGFTWQAPFGGRIIINGGDRLGFLVLAGASVEARLRIVCEE